MNARATLVGSLFVVGVGCATASGQRSIPLDEVIKENKVSVEIRGMGGSTGDSMELVVQRKVPQALRLTLAPGTVFRSQSDAVQNMLVASIKGERRGELTYRPTREILLADNDEHTYVIEAYCMDFHKANPGRSDSFLLSPPDEFGIKILQAGKSRSASIQAIQAALWIERDCVSPTELKRRFPVSDEDIEVARGLIDSVQRGGEISSPHSSVPPGKASAPVRAVPNAPTTPAVPTIPNVPTLPKSPTIPSISKTSADTLPESAVMESDPGPRHEPELRTWTDVTGKYKTEAAFLDYKDGKVWLKKKDATVISVAIDRLGVEDQQFVRQHSVESDSAIEWNTARGGEVWVHPKTRKKMVLVPSRYIRPNSESSRVFGFPVFYDKEKRPVAGLVYVGFSEHFVTGFFIDSTEVTNGDYLRYVQATAAAMPTSWEQKAPSDERLQHPAAVSYEEAERYAKWAGLRLPCLREYCGAAADDKGIYPWREDEIYSATAWSPVGRNKEDTSPLGVWDLAGNAWEWGSDKYRNEATDFRLAFALFRLEKDDANRPAASWIPVSIPEKTQGFRCVDDLVAVQRTIQGGLVGDANSVSEPETVMCPVTIKNELPSDAVVMISNAQNVQVSAKGQTEIELPIGTYLITFKTVGPGAKILRFWRCQLHELPPTSAPGQGKKGRSYTWTLTRTAGEEVE